MIQAAKILDSAKSHDCTFSLVMAVSWCADTVCRPCWLFYVEKSAHVAGHCGENRRQNGNRNWTEPVHPRLTVHTPYTAYSRPGFTKWNTVEQFVYGEFFLRVGKWKHSRQTAIFNERKLNCPEQDSNPQSLAFMFSALLTKPPRQLSRLGSNPSIIKAMQSN